MTAWIVSSCVLLLVLLLLRRLLRGKLSPRLQYALWALALVRLLLPVSLGSSAVSVANLLQQAAPEEALSSTVVGYLGGDLPDLAPALPDPNLSEAEQEAQYEENLAQWRAELDAARVETGTPVTVEHILMAVWGCGALLLALCFLWANLRLGRALRRTRQLLPQRAGRLPVYLTQAVDTPCLFGLIRPAVYLTPAAARDPVTARHALEHEYTHYRHADHLWAVLRCVCLCLHWYNPLVWWAALASRNDGELACDEATVRRLGEEERVAYGRTLLALTCVKRPALLTTATTMTGSGKTLQARIAAIVKRPRTAAITFAVVLLIAAVAAGCTFPGAESSEPAEEGPTGLSHGALEFADQFDRYNDPQAGYDFQISQGELGGQPCYLLHNEAHGVNVLVPENGYDVQAVVEYQGRSLTFEMPQFVLGYGAVSGEAALWLEDLTGDGTPELVYIYGSGGTGMWHDQVKIFDLAAMAECPVVQNTALFEGAVELEFVELRAVQAETGQDTQAVYRITGPNGELDYAGVSLPGGAEEAARQPQPVMGYYETISLKSGQLIFCTSLSAGLTADPSFSSLGSLSAPFVYGRQTGTFALTGSACLVRSQAALDDLSHITFSPGLDAQGAAEEFVREGYPNLFLSLPATHPRAILRYELMDWSIREVSEDGNAVVGTFHYAFEPADWNSPEIWAGSTHMGSGEYADLAANQFEFLLCRGEDGAWTCVSVATGGVQLP